MLQIMKLLFLIWPLFFLGPFAWSADVYLEKAPPHKHCALRGSAKAGSTKAKENAQKNRWRPPLQLDFDNTATTQALVQPGTDRARWSNERAARIRGYVAVVKQGTRGESCNCGATALIDSDTHIAVVTNSNMAQDKRTYVIVEITPRIRKRLIMSAS